MTDILLAVLILGLANGAIAQIVTHSTLFEPLRDLAKDAAGENILADYFEEWITCALCMGTWSAGTLTAGALWLSGWPDDRPESIGAWIVGTFAVQMIGLVAGYTYRVLLAAVEKLDT